MSSNIYEKIAEARKLLEQKKAFVPMPGGQGEPVAGAGPMTAAVASGGMGGDPMEPATAGGMPPMDPTMMGGAGGMPPPMDPAAMGGATVDPAAMPPPPAEDPAMAGMSPDGNITMPVSQLLSLVQVLLGKAVDGAVAGAGDVKTKKAKEGDKLTEIHQALTNAGLIQPQVAAPQA